MISKRFSVVALESRDSNPLRVSDIPFFNLLHQGHHTRDFNLQDSSRRSLLDVIIANITLGEDQR
jgi:hypothetical protein